MLHLFFYIFFCCRKKKLISVLSVLAEWFDFWTADQSLFVYWVHAIRWLKLFFFRHQPLQATPAISSLQINMTFTEDYAAVLLPFVEEYKKSKNGNARKVIVQNAADAVSKSGDLREDGAEDLPKDLKTVCYFSFKVFLYLFMWIQPITRYIKAFIEKESCNDDDNSKPSKLKQSYKIRDVIKQIHQERIEQEIPHSSNDKQYLSCYQRAVTTVYQNLSNDELKEAEGILDSWNKQGAPFEKQLKWVLKVLTSFCAK